MKKILLILVCILAVSCCDNTGISKHQVRLDAIDGSNLQCYDEDLKKEVVIPYSADIFVISLSTIIENSENSIKTLGGIIYLGTVIHHIVFILTYSNGCYYE